MEQNLLEYILNWHFFYQYDSYFVMTMESRDTWIEPYKESSFINMTAIL